MPDLDDRFRSLSRVRTPDLWADIGERRPGPVPGPPAGPRIVAAVVAFVLAAAGFAGAVFVLGRETPPPRLGSPPMNGRIAFAAFDGARWQIYTAEPDGTSELQITTLKGEDAFQPAWSPDGRRLAFVVQTDGRSDIYTIDADGTGFTRLTDDGGSHLPSWSPDGTRLAYSRAAGDGTEDIWVMKADGTSATRMTQERRSVVSLSPSWSPDGTHIVFVSNRSGTPQIYEMDARGDAVTQLTTDDGFHAGPEYSPDGTRIAFAGDVGGPGLFTMAVDGSGVERLTGEPQVGPLDLSWAPDGRFIVYSTTVESGDVLVVVDVATRDSTTVVQARDVCCPTWQPIPTAVSESPAPSESPSSEVAPLRGEIAVTLQVGADVRSVVYGEGSVWVAVSNNDGTFAGQILRIDPSTNETLATIPVETIPTWEVGGGAMVVGDGSLWVTGGIEAPGGPDSPGGGSDAAVIRIDTSTNAVVDGFSVGGTVGADLTFLDGDLWVLLFGDETVDHRMEVARVDPSRAQVLTRIPLTTTWAHTIVAAGGRLLVLEGGRLVVNKGGQLTSIDPATDAVGASAEIPSPYSAEGPVVWRDELWAGVEHGFARFDTETGEEIDRSSDLDPSRWSLGRMSLEADDRGIWFLGYNGLQGSGPVRLAMFDPEADAVIELVALEEGNPVAMAVGSDSVWILNYEGTLTRVDLVQD
jgi:Tol biopolymer transport system component